MYTYCIHTEKNHNVYVYMADIHKRKSNTPKFLFYILFKIS